MLVCYFYTCRLTSVSSVQVVLPYYEKYSAQIDRMMSEAATSAEGIIKSAVDTLETEEAKQE